ncbi:MAG: TIGR02281 family clan AA aspartic protease [Sphingomonadaceae bacterium]
MTIATHSLTFFIGGAFGLFIASGSPQPAPPAPRHALVSNAIDTVLDRHEDGHFYVDAMVNGQLVRFVVDTGASSVALTEADAERVGLTVDPRQFTVVGMGAGGPVRGAFTTLESVAIGQKEANGVEGAILKGASISLLGQSFLSRVGSVRIVGDQMILR